ncbi:MAG: polyribonucleotide nucleotidyltransferase [Thermoguttaceae bacterium]|nr:polyribonucleotide nucleotidyltransferase [Thermoguttaceae bacterium]
MKKRVERNIGGKLFWIETGQIAKQAHGAVLMGCDNTVVLCAVTTAPAKPGQDFFPLSCDYRERMAAAGKFPGGFNKREGRPSLKEVLTSRLIDRPMRPLFPEGFTNEVQVQALTMSCDKTIDPDIVAMNGCATAVEISPLPFDGPLAAVRLGLIDGQIVPFPTFEQLENSELDLVVSGNMDSILMIEGFARELGEKVVYEALVEAHGYIKELCSLQQELIDMVAPEKMAYQAPPADAIYKALMKDYYDAFRAAKRTEGKAARAEACCAVRAKAAEALVIPEEEAEAMRAEGKTPLFTSELFDVAFHQFERRVVRDIILAGERLDGRAVDEVRPIECSINVLPPCVHGSALFQRGETQALVSITLGGPEDMQRVDGLFDEYKKRFMLDYNFPSYSVGECKPNRGVGRREYGHGMLAERSVKSVLPDAEDFYHTIRAISDITESNGSSSMATVCGTTLALLAAGVPLKSPVAGISIGLVKESDDDWITLTDIMGDEDHFGDMDFKIAGTQRGVTGIQLDLKIHGINWPIIQRTFVQAHTARVGILRKMMTVINRPAENISPYAPRLFRTQIDPSKIGLLIGPGGKTIRAIQESTGAKVDVEDDGMVVIVSADEASATAALEEVNKLTASVEVGKIYRGRVASIQTFGLFVEVLPGRDGLCHISELSDAFVDDIRSFCKIGDELEVKVISIDEQNRIKLSHKAVLLERKAAEGGDDDGQW